MKKVLLLVTCILVIMTVPACKLFSDKPDKTAAPEVATTQAPAPTEAPATAPVETAQ